MEEGRQSPGGPLLSLGGKGFYGRQHPSARQRPNDPSPRHLRHACHRAQSRHIPGQAPDAPVRGPPGKPDFAKQQRTGWPGGPDMEAQGTKKRRVAEGRHEAAPLPMLHDKNAFAISMCPLGPRPSKGAKSGKTSLHPRMTAAPRLENARQRTADAVATAGRPGHGVRAAAPPCALPHGHQSAPLHVSAVYLAIASTTG